MSNSPKDRGNKDLSRRDFLKHCASGVVALPFVLAVPSNAPNVITGNDSLLPFQEREEAFREGVADKLAQLPRPLPTPPLPKPPPPQRITYNTTYSTSKQTSAATSTTSGNPPTSDDSNTDTHYDGSTEDWKTDVR